MKTLEKLKKQLLALQMREKDTRKKLRITLDKQKRSTQTKRKKRKHD